VATLESYVSVLRRRLQPGTPARRSVIRTLPSAYRLDRDAVSTDLDLFDDLVSEAGHRTDLDARRLLDQASALASADLLESQDDTAWAEPIRADYRQRAVRAALRAGELALPHDADAALRLAGRALGLDVLCEPAWCLMIRIHAATGHRNKALHAYRSCRRLLAQELGIHPAPRTRAVLAEVVANSHRPGRPVSPQQTDLGTVVDATLTLFEHQRIGEATGGLDDAVHVVAALLPLTQPAPMTVIDPRQALHSAAVRLHDEFDGTFRDEIVRQVLYADYDRLLADSTVRNYLPLLAERSARRRLRALAATDPQAAGRVLTVVFRHAPGTAYSRMALGFFDHLAGEGAVAWCEGHEPAEAISPAAIAAMAERGIDITGQLRRPWADRLGRAADVVVSFGYDDVDLATGGRHLDWRTDEVADDIERLRPIRDDIERKVRTLLMDLGVPLII
jgi:DNA-binding SARP family transcriptional activator/protein-tyrosine-phosphatase